MGYILDSTTIPRPKGFIREELLVGQDVVAINGRTGRDIRNRKERFILSWEVLSNAEVSTIMTIVEKNEAVTFSVAETNLTINETSVIVSIESIEYKIIGSNYIAALALELVEVQ